MNTSSALAANASQFRSRLRETRKTRGLNQEQLAMKAGLRSAVISQFERGTRKPSFDTLRKLADALEASVDYLVGRTENINGQQAGDADIFRDYESLTDANRELARDFIARLARRNKEK